MFICDLRLVGLIFPLTASVSVSFSVYCSSLVTRTSVQ